MKKIIYEFLITMTLVGCSKNSTTTNIDKKLETNGNCTAVECIEKISIDNTVDEINKIIGIDGKLTDEKYNKYYWELSVDTGIEVSYYSGKKGTIKVDIEKDLLANKNIDFSKYEELQSKVKSGISYNDFIKYLGNTNGVLIEKSGITNKYIWVSKDGSYLNASFSNSSGECTFVSGMIK